MKVVIIANENAVKIVGLFLHTSVANIEDADLGHENVFLLHLQMFWIT